jgi:cysteine synthase A
MYTDSILNLIGNTPLISFKNLYGLNIFAKAEFLNPGGSIKDRIAKFMIEQAEKEGILKPSMTIMEATSGNTGIGLTLVGAQKGYRVVIVMPENMSDERKTIIRLLGGELILTPRSENVEGALNEVKRQLNGNSNIFVPNQFTNTNNPLIHYNTTALEIWNQLNGNVDIFVSGIGSGGTLQGVGKFLKEKNPKCIIAAVEPKNVSALLGQTPGFHKIQGIGDGFIPQVLDVSLIDDIIMVNDEDAIETTKKIARLTGALVGISAGANIWSAEKMAEKYGKDKNIVTILPDRAERYFSMNLFDEE